MNINLNDDSFNPAQGVAIFNGGNAGTVENVKVSLVRKSAEDKEMAPDYKIIFTDNNGAACNTPLWYVSKATQWQTVEQLIKKQGKILKHLLHCALGPNAQLPVVSSAEAMLDESMKMLKTALPNLGSVRVFANYGTNDYRKKYIQIRSWVPFVESMSVPADASNLKPGDLDGMTRLVEDAVSTGGEVNAVVADDEADW